MQKLPITMLHYSIMKMLRVLKLLFNLVLLLIWSFFSLPGLNINKTSQNTLEVENGFLVIFNWSHIFNVCLLNVFFRNCKKWYKLIKNLLFNQITKIQFLDSQPNYAQMIAQKEKKNYVCCKVCNKHLKVEKLLFIPCLCLIKSIKIYMNELFLWFLLY